MGADRHPAQPELLDAVFELLDGQLRVLHGSGRESDEAIRMRRAQLGELLVLRFDEFFGEVAVGLVPERIDADRLDVDALRVHLLDARVVSLSAAGATFRPIMELTSGNAQWAWMSTVFTRLPLTTTSRRRGAPSA